MQLGDILDGGAEFYPVGREVEFHVLKHSLEALGEERAGERQRLRWHRPFYLCYSTKPGWRWFMPAFLL